MGVDPDGYEALQAAQDAAANNRFGWTLLFLALVLIFALVASIPPKQ